MIFQTVLVWTQVCNVCSGKCKVCVHRRVFPSYIKTTGKLLTSFEGSAKWKSDQACITRGTQLALNPNWWITNIHTTLLYYNWMRCSPLNHTSEKISADNGRQADQFTPVIYPPLRDCSAQSKKYTNFLARWRAPPPCQKCPRLALAKGCCGNDNCKKILMACDAGASMKYDCDRTIFLSCRSSLFATVTCGLKWCSIIASSTLLLQLA